ncbi:hypothetical protein CEXT_116941 [Caerostris extrusa]|uniref:Uncharacterized protein n=1 Tax=Caerostris extrusa TaxID=172846 RepID=A0AAV4XYX1_CAEEX|nr:hypothetical protein CEXT_116941 [Caerostris extrusa]
MIKNYDLITHFIAPISYKKNFIFQHPGKRIHCCSHTIHKIATRINHRRTCSHTAKNRSPNEQRTVVLCSLFQKDSSSSKSTNLNGCCFNKYFSSSFSTGCGSW